MPAAFTCIFSALTGVLATLLAVRVLSRRRLTSLPTNSPEFSFEESLLYRLVFDDLSDDVVLAEAARAFPVWNGADQWSVAFVFCPDDCSTPPIWLAAYRESATELNGRFGLRVHAYPLAPKSIALVLAWQRGGSPCSGGIPQFVSASLQKIANQPAEFRFGDVVERPSFLRNSRRSAQSENETVQVFTEAEIADNNPALSPVDNLLSADAPNDELSNTFEPDLPGTLRPDILEYIQHGYTNPSLSRSIVAARFNLSDDYLSTLIKNLSGQTFSNYLEGVRIQAAHRLLQDSRLTVDEVSAAVGYNSARAFRRAFKRTTGLSPTDSRKDGDPL